MMMMMMMMILMILMTYQTPVLWRIGNGRMWGIVAIFNSTLSYSVQLNKISVPPALTLAGVSRGEYTV